MPWLEFLPLVNMSQDTQPGLPELPLIMLIQEEVLFWQSSLLSWRQEGRGQGFPRLAPAHPPHSGAIWSVVSAGRMLASHWSGRATLGCDWLTLAQRPRHMVRATHYITHSSLTKQEHFLMTHLLEDRDNLCLSSSNLQMILDSTSL